VSFRLIYELEPPREPDLRKVRWQIDVMGPGVDAILIPDNHLGRAALSSVALAIEVQNKGFTPLVALNARDRNRLRLKSDLMTLRAYGVEEVLLLHGDRSVDEQWRLTVREMLEEESGDGLRRGVVANVGKPLGWRQKADFVFTKLAFGSADFPSWRANAGFAGDVYCGVIALSDRSIAKKVLQNIPDLNEPTGYLAAFDNDDEAGFTAALSELDRLLDSGADGAHLVVPAGRLRFAERLDEWATSKGTR
jgi:methylenetetrahydrofolate reductase (NADPH)